MIACKLVHDTGTMIRFRTSQLGDLPSSSRDIQIVLPSGHLVVGHFNRHPQNPNVSGAELVRFIKRRIGFKEREDVLVEMRSKSLWALYTLEDVAPLASAAGTAIGSIKKGKLAAPTMAALMALADREGERGRRIAWYRRVLRPSGLRRMMVDLVGGNCMVQGCHVCSRLDSEWGAGSGAVIVEVHHVEEMARVIDHHPKNLCVLCANHHRFIHSSGSWEVRHEGPNVVFGRASNTLVVERPASLFMTA